MRVIRVGRQALLVEVDHSAQAQALYAQARQRHSPAVDVVPGASTVLFDGVDDPDALAQQLAGWSLAASDAPSGNAVEIPTRYDGEDLAAVARHWGSGPADVVRTHTETLFTVAFCGFAPGFAYCTGLAPELAVPRLASPRGRVPAGAVGLAGAYTGVYPRSTPGGWQLIGHTDLTLWDPAADPPALLVPGTRVRFVAVEP